MPAHMGNRMGTMKLHKISNLFQTYKTYEEKNRISMKVGGI